MGDKNQIIYIREFFRIVHIPILIIDNPSQIFRLYIIQNDNQDYQ
jgi:hypothetical protein